MDRVVVDLDERAAHLDLDAARAQRGGARARVGDGLVDDGLPRLLPLLVLLLLGAGSAVAAGALVLLLLRERRRVRGELVRALDRLVAALHVGALRD